MTTAMELDPHPEIREAVARICAGFDLDYWRRCDEEGRFAREFFEAIRDAGFLSIIMPAELGGAGLGMQAAAVMVRTIAEAGGGWTAASTVHAYIFGPMSIVAHGSPEKRARMLPPLISGRERPCFGVTEPSTGLDTTRIRTRAVRRGDTYYITGQKVWTTGAAIADRILLLARTTPIEETARPVDGLSLFFAPMDPRHVTVRPIPKHGLGSIASCEVFIEELPVPVQDRIGEEGHGFRCLLDSLNPERIMVAAETVGIGRAALGLAARYAKEREVFGRKIGQNQAIQHPLAQGWMELEAANLMTMKAAALYDAKQPCGAEANAAKFLAAEAANKACRQAMITHGGYGYAKEYHVERLARESMIPVLAPVGQALVLSYIAERVLDLPKSY
ncbi:acyl-CoA dehydrogenase family protein [Rubritepida flocculans]|uniref:acyl-CoA dehydrogenase family protein n=1 Tax=Rubritepida flocculans TaxID=182403 RepID=UPI00041B679C|nr:acyl-CoA dehydrogenase family protein [Rubritepida flocculans]